MTTDISTALDRVLMKRAAAVAGQNAMQGNMMETPGENTPQQLMPSGAIGMSATPLANSNAIGTPEDQQYLQEQEPVVQPKAPFNTPLTAAGYNAVPPNQQVQPQNSPGQLPVKLTP